MSSFTRAIVFCALGAITAACTALTGADDLTIQDKAQSIGRADPEQQAKDAGPRASGARPASDAGTNATDTNSPPPAPTVPPKEPPAVPDAGAKPTVAVGCGQLTCTGTTATCCAAVGAYTCVDDATACVGTRYRLTCDSPEDCAGGEVCCAFFGVNEGARCVSAASCNAPTNDRARLCTSNGHCPIGQACGGYIIDESGERLDLPSGLCIYR